MAQEIGYMENNATFTEGPFVLCNALGNGWRIEVESPGHRCPVLPDCSIYAFRRAQGIRDGKFNEKAEATSVCDLLNQKVREGVLTLWKGSCWVWPERFMDCC